MAIRIFRDFSLQTRLSLILSSLLAIVLIASSVIILAFSEDQLLDEHKMLVGFARDFSSTVNVTLARDPGSESGVKALLASLPAPKPGVVFFRPDESVLDIDGLMERGRSGAPDWFVALVAPAVHVERLPVTVGDRKLGEIMFSPDLTPDLFEKWFIFMMSSITGFGLIGAIAVITYFTVRRTLRPLRDLENSIVDLRSGHYGARLAFAGPPELGRSFSELNGLSDRLHELSRENSGLLRQLVSVQDAERRDLSRELHDELGPQLFAIRASASSLAGLRDSELETGLERLSESVEALQNSNRRILERLRPMHLQELGLIKSVEGLVRGAREQNPDTAFSLDFAPVLAESDAVTLQTVYRFVQEALTNVQRHAKAARVHVSGVRTDGMVRIEVADDGIGIEGAVPGRGITGMRERVRALGGTFVFERSGGMTRVAAIIPFSHA